MLEMFPPDEEGSRKINFILFSSLMSSLSLADVH